MNRNEMNKLFVLANKSIDKAIKILKSNIPKIDKFEKKEIKLNVDKSINNEIFRVLKQSKIKIISEENPKNQNLKILEKEKNFWIIDPLDGSFNFYRNIPFSSVCISLILNGKFELSIIYDVFNKIKYTNLNNKIYVNNVLTSFKRKKLKKNKSILTSGFPKNYNFKKKNYIFKSFIKTRMIGCASLSLIGCMTGKFDWYNEKNIMLWDIAAGYHFNVSNGCTVKKFNLKMICQEVSLGYSF